jgi:hypothetical protein
LTLVRCIFNVNETFRVRLVSRVTSAASAWEVRRTIGTLPPNGVAEGDNHRHESGPQRSVPAEAGSMLVESGRPLLPMVVESPVRLAAV